MPLEGARPHVSDLQPPDLIETMRADAQGVVALLSGHLRRLEQSAHTLGHVWPGQLAVESAIHASVAALATPRPQHLRLRLLMGAQGQLHVEVFPLPAITGVPAIAVTTRTLDSRERLLQHKTVHRPWYASTTAWLASHPDFFDLIFLNERGEVCEGSRSNIYVLKNGVWHTPPLHCGLLGGVMRRQLLDQDAVVESVLAASDLEAPTAAIRLSNGLRGWFDVKFEKNRSLGLSGG